MLAGALAGLAASWVMNEFQSGWSKVQQKFEKNTNRRQSPEDEDATMKTVGLIARDVLKVEVSKEQRQKLAPIVHYAFGTVVGAVYGALAERFPAVVKGWGTEYATLVFVAVDELAVPALKLSQPSKKTPISVHLYAWASHLVYGASTESARRLLRHALEKKREPRLFEIRAAQRKAA
jgi:uncharacterized membrane protein YagU involved in acid resistance